jgi:hypothetical protein
VTDDEDAVGVMVVPSIETFADSDSIAAMLDA